MTHITSGFQSVSSTVKMIYYLLLDFGIVQIFAVVRLETGIGT